MRFAGLGRIALVVAVVFFLAATAAFASSGKQNACCLEVRVATHVVTTPIKVLKEVALVGYKVQRSGESLLIRTGVDVLTRSLDLLRRLGLAQVEIHGRPVKRTI